MSHLVFTPYHADARAFVFSTFSESLRQTGVDRTDRLAYERAMGRAMLEPDARTCIVSPAGHPEEFLGWSVALPDALLYVYVRFDYRRGKCAPVLGEEGRHIGHRLIKHVDGVWSQVPAALWTKDASRMAAAGYPIRYDLDQHERFRQLAR